MARVVNDDFTLLHRSWINGLTLDDTLWFLSIVAAQSQNFRQAGDMPYNDQNFWRILQMGYQDPGVNDRPWDASTRAMRYAAIIGDRLQCEVERERAKVSLVLFNRIGDLAKVILLIERPIGAAD